MPVFISQIGLFGKSLIDEKDILTNGGAYGDWALLGFISVVILVGMFDDDLIRPRQLEGGGVASAENQIQYV